MGRKISDICLKQGQGMRGRAVPPHPGICRVPPPPPRALKSATSSVGFNDLINLLHKALLRMPHETSCINFVLERNKTYRLSSSSVVFMIAYHTKRYRRR